LYNGASKCVFADPLEKIDWLPSVDTKSAFIPIGANIPDAIPPHHENHVEQNGATKNIAVFGVTDRGDQHERQELADIAHAVRIAAEVGVNVKLLFMGRGVSEAGEAIRRCMQGIAAEVSILGLLNPNRLAESLARCDAMLFVRGTIHPRRGTVMAGIACGLPVIGYSGLTEGTPLAEAGLELVPYGDRDALGAALTRILTDASLRRILRQRSVCAYQKYFSWQTIAERYIRFLEAEVNGASDRV
jgi:glycosyltransferase involved in cell wall biosynthesis